MIFKLPLEPAKAESFIKMLASVFFDSQMLFPYREKVEYLGEIIKEMKPESNIFCAEILFRIFYAAYPCPSLSMQYHLDDRIK